MACFIVPGAEAVVTTVITKIVENKEHKKNKENEQKNNLLSYNNAIDTEVTEATNNINRLPFSKKLKWLNNMLWGGTTLLAFEHLWHGEITPWFPFLTAAGNPQDAAQMFHEMATTGVCMALIVTMAWALMLIVTSVIEKTGDNEEGNTDINV